MYEETVEEWKVLEDGIYISVYEFFSFSRRQKQFADESKDIIQETSLLLAMRKNFPLKQMQMPQCILNDIVNFKKTILKV